MKNRQGKNITLLLSKYILFLIIVISGCYSDTESRRIKEEEQTKLFVLKKLFEANKQLDSLRIKLYEEKEKNAVLIERVEHLIERNNSNIEQSLNYNKAIISTYYLNDKMEANEKEKNALLRETKELQKKYENSLIEKEDFKYKLSYEQQLHKITIKERDKAEKSIEELSELKINSLSITGFGNNIFGKDYETNKAGKIKKAKVYFTFPANKYSIKEKKYISVTIYSVDKSIFIEKDTTIEYLGKEYNIPVILTGKVFTKGSHLVSIRINGKLEQEKDFIVLN